MSSSYSLETSLKRFDHLFQIWGLSTKKLVNNQICSHPQGQTTHPHIPSIPWLQLHSNVGYFQFRCPKWLVTASRPWCHRIQSKFLIDRSGMLLSYKMFNPQNLWAKTWGVCLPHRTPVTTFRVITAGLVHGLEVRVKYPIFFIIHYYLNAAFVTKRTPWQLLSIKRCRVRDYYAHE